MEVVLSPEGSGDPDVPSRRGSVGARITGWL